MDLYIISPEILLMDILSERGIMFASQHAGRLIKGRL